MEIKRNSIDFDVEDIYELEDELELYTNGKKLFKMKIDDKKDLYLSVILVKNADLYTLRLEVFKGDFKLYSVEGNTFDHILKVFRTIFLCHSVGDNNTYYLIKVNPTAGSKIDRTIAGKIILNGYSDNILTSLFYDLLYSSFDSNKEIFNMYMKFIYTFRYFIEFEDIDSSKSEEIEKINQIIKLLYYRGKYFSLDIDLNKKVTKKMLYELEDNFKSKDFYSVNSEDEFIDKLTNYICLVSPYIYSYINNNIDNSYDLISDDTLIEEVFELGFKYFY